MVIWFGISLTGWVSWCGCDEQIAECRAVLGLIEQGVFSVEHRAFKDSFDEVIVQRRAGHA